MKEMMGQRYSTGRVAIAISRFNEDVTSRLLEGALDALKTAGVSEECIDLVYVPGAFELPIVLDTLLARKLHVGAIALGAVIRGDTPHFDYVCSECARGIMKVMLRHQVPVAFGVLTTDTEAHALERAGGKEGNKGADAALTLLDTVGVCQEIGSLV